MSSRNLETQQLGGVYVQYLLLSELWGKKPRPFGEIAEPLGRVCAARGFRGEGGAARIQYAAGGEALPARVWGRWRTRFMRRRAMFRAACGTRSARLPSATAWRRTNSGNERKSCGRNGRNQQPGMWSRGLSACAASVPAAICAGEDSGRSDHDGLRRRAAGGGAAASGESCRRSRWLGRMRIWSRWRRGTAVSRRRCAMPTSRCRTESRW